MSAPDPRLSAADAALVALATVIATARGADLRWLPDRRDDLRAILPGVSREHRRIGPLAAACDRLALTQKIDLDFLRGPDWARIHHEIRGEVHALSLARAEAAMERARGGEGRAA